MPRLWRPNYEESRVPRYKLPDLMLCQDGTRVGDIATWESKRRPELLELFREHVYGRSPGRPLNLHWHVLDETEMPDGRSRRRRVRIFLTESDTELWFDLCMHIPANARGPVPFFLGLNFWPGEPPLDRGYGMATLHNETIVPDVDDGFAAPVYQLFLDMGVRCQSLAALSTWAWGLSRALDYLETDPDVIPNRVAILGHSRLGKAVLWAGANDPRFWMIISNCSGCGGAALSRRAFGENLWRINTSFPYWFCTRFHTYNDKEGDLPVDQHELIALCAPRPVYVASAADDRWADPRGEFLSAYHAGPAYALYGAKAPATPDFPAAYQPVGDSLRYCVRAGQHDLTNDDWDRFMDFADQRLLGQTGK